MVRTEKTKSIALALTIVCIFLSVVPSVLDGFPVEKVGICKDCTIFARLAFSFFHASILHALINCWCLLSVAFIYDVKPSSLITAYIIAATFPVTSLCSAIGDSAAESLSTPTVGLSAVCFALLGMVSFQAKRRLYFHSFILSFILIGFFLPFFCSVCGYDIATPNNILHLYCYVAGLIVGFLNSPAPWQK